MTILALNGGSSSIKAALFSPELERLQQWSFVCTKEGLRWKDTFIRCTPDTTTACCLSFIAEKITEAPTLITHRIVHGGDYFHDAVLLNEETLHRLQTLVQLAPLHQPFNLALIHAAQQQWPNAQQLGCFDTAFHQTQSNLQRRYSLPRALHDAGIKRYGFHGLSYAYVSRALFQQVPALETGRIIIAHLGSGASLCALHNGKSIATSMGFSTLDGVMMATRCGALDPGIILHWMREGLDLNTIEKRLYKESGLLGVSGISSNLQVLLNATEQAAQEAVALFVLRCCEMIGSLAANLQGVDALVFTGGIGEHQAETRARIVQSLAWLGAKLDVSSNTENGFLITTADSKLPVYVIATDEEQEMAQQAIKAAYKLN